jgi:hypothetical protein
VTCETGRLHRVPEGLPSRHVAYILATLVGLAFGAAVQQLGAASSFLGAWTATAAQVSAPWLILPFLAGMTQEVPRRAMIIGLVISEAALLGYFAMTYSPLEIHPWTLDRFVDGMIAITTRGGYNPAFIISALITGPAFGLLGQRWRVRRWWVSAALVAGALCFEPIARWASGRLMPPSQIWVVEVALGLVVGGGFALSLIQRRQAAR